VGRRWLEGWKPERRSWSRVCYGRGVVRLCSAGRGGTTMARQQVAASGPSQTRSGPRWAARLARRLEVVRRRMGATTECFCRREVRYCMVARGGLLLPERACEVARVGGVRPCVAQRC
jgi:hypothetical protein